MLEECKPDVVSICVPNQYHKEWSIAALEAGANVLCEKPICVTLADAKEIYAAARERGRIFMPVQERPHGGPHRTERYDQRRRSGRCVFWRM